MFSDSSDSFAMQKTPLVCWVRRMYLGNRETVEEVRQGEYGREQERKNRT
jgi:hypothetical protein